MIGRDCFSQGELRHGQNMAMITRMIVMMEKKEHRSQKENNNNKMMMLMIWMEI